MAPSDPEPRKSDPGFSRLDDSDDAAELLGWLDDVAVRMEQSGLAETYRRPVLDQRPGTILDIGCGSGLDLVALRTLAPAAELIGVDSSIAALEQAAARPGSDSIQWLHTEAGAIPLGDERVDSVLLNRVLLHLASPVAVLREAARVLRPNGRLVIAESMLVALAEKARPSPTFRLVFAHRPHGVSSAAAVLNTVAPILVRSGFRLEANERHTARVSFGPAEEYEIVLHVSVAARGS